MAIVAADAGNTVADCLCSSTSVGLDHVNAPCARVWIHLAVCIVAVQAERDGIRGCRRVQFPPSRGDPEGSGRSNRLDLNNVNIGSRVRAQPGVRISAGEDLPAIRACKRDLVMEQTGECIHVGGRRALLQSALQRLSVRLSDL